LTCGTFIKRQTLSLSGYANPFRVRIIAVANGYDAMTLDHPYRCALASRQTIQSLLEGRHKQWMQMWSMLL